MEITFRCAECQDLIDVSTVPKPGAISCSSCGAPAPLNPSQSLLHENMVDSCPRCEKTSFYVQKDFNQKLGLVIVVLCAMVGLVFVWMDRPLWFYAILAAGVVFDLLMYAIISELTVCYACKTTFRNAKRNPAHKPFDLHIADHHEGRSQA